MPTVSVIIPTYNRADLLMEALRSVLAQTYQDFEAIVIDDGSTDNTTDVVARLGDDRIHYHSKAHTGLPADSRNVGIQQSRGRYVAFLDSDDLWLPDKLKRQVRHLSKHPSCGLVCMNARIIGDHPRAGQPLLRKTPPSGHVFVPLLWENYILTLTVMVPRAVLNKVGLFDLDPAIRAGEDYDLWLRIAHDYPMCYLSVVGGLYRFHATNIFADRRHVDLLYLRVIERAAARYGLPARLVDRLAAVHHARLAFHYLRQGREADFREALRAGWRRRPSAIHVVLRSAYAVLGARRLVAFVDRGRAVGLRLRADHF